MKNLKTNLTGLSIVGFITVYFFNLITTEQFLTATTFLTGLGFFFAKDHKKEE